MSLPTSRDETTTGGAQVRSMLANDLQDAIIAHERWIRGRAGWRRFHDEMTYTMTAVTATGEIGPWFLFELGGSSVSVAGVPSTALASGIAGALAISRETGGGAGDVIAQMVSGLWLPRTRDFVVRAKVRVTTRAELDTIANFGFAVGAGTDSSGFSLAFPGFYCGSDDTNWHIKGPSGDSDSGVAVTDNTFYDLCCEILAGVAYFYIDGVEIVAARAASVDITTNRCPYISINANGSIADAAEACAIDYFEMGMAP